jgi:hypothetical protein
MNPINAKDRIVEAERKGDALGSTKAGALS